MAGETELEKLLVVIDAETERLRRELRRGTTATQKFERSVNRSLGGVEKRFNATTLVSKRLVAAMGGLAAASAGLRGIRSVATDFARFEAAMNQVQAVSGATVEQFELMRNRAIALGNSTKFAASEVADAMKFMSMAGLNANQVYGGIAATLNLAAAANMEMGQAADIVTNILTGFGKDVSELNGAVDVLAKTFTSSNTDLQQLGQALKFVGPVASAAGFEFEEVAAALGLLGNAGMQAEMAGTGLRGMILRLVDPSKEAQRAMDSLGISVKNQRGQLLPLIDILKQFEPHSRNLELFSTVFAQRAGPAVINLAKAGSTALRTFRNELREAGGTADHIAKVQMRGLAGAFTEAQSAAEGFKIAIGDTGVGAALETMVRAVASGTRELTHLLRTFQAVDKQGQATLKRHRDDLVKDLDTVNKRLESSQGRNSVVDFALGFVNQSREGLTLQKQWIERRLTLVRDALSKREKMVEDSRKRENAKTLQDALAKEKALAAAGGGTTQLPDIASGGGNDRNEAVQRLRNLRARMLAETGRTRELIGMEHKTELAEFKEMLDQKLITAEEYEQARRDLALVTKQRVNDFMQEEMRFASAVVDRFAQGAEDAFSEWVETGKLKTKELVRSMLADLAKLAFRQTITDPLRQGFSGLLGGLFGGFRASGGPVERGKAYVVGERGPELFAPSVPGKIIPSMAGREHAGSGGMSVTFHNVINADGAVEGTAAQIAKALEANNRKLERDLPGMMANVERRYK